MAYSGNSFNSGRGSEPGDSYTNIPQNRTLIAEKLTRQAPHIPTIVHNLQTLEQVFDHYKPTVEIVFDTVEGEVKNETLAFNSVEDFAIERIKEQSKFLVQSIEERNEYLKMMKQLKGNTALRTLLADGEARKTLLEAINCMRGELNKNK